MTDATLVVSRAVQHVTDDPQIVDATLLNKVLQEINAKLQLLESMNTRLEAMEKKLENRTPGTPDAPDANGHEYVDLGMTDANGNPVYWATCNVGAENPEDAGLYFAWGETKGYGSDTSDGRSFDWDSYKWSKGSYNTLTKYCTDSYYGPFGTVDDKTVLDPEDDAAHVNWGGDWRMPTDNELVWLCKNCTWQWDSSGSTVTSKQTGNSIFLPAAGLRNGSDLYDAGSEVNYWSSSLFTSSAHSAWHLNCNESSIWYTSASTIDRYYGLSVRAVCVLSK